MGCLAMLFFISLDYFLNPTLKYLPRTSLSSSSVLSRNVLRYVKERYNFEICLLVLYISKGKTDMCGDLKKHTCSTQEGQPAELKHITKRRKRKQKRFP